MNLRDIPVMKLGGIVIAVGGVLLFFWHLLRGEFDPNTHSGYASHQVMSVDSLILVSVGAVFFFWGEHRHRRRTRTGREANAFDGESVRDEHDRSG